MQMIEKRHKSKTDRPAGNYWVMVGVVLYIRGTGEIAATYLQQMGNRQRICMAWHKGHGAKGQAFALGFMDINEL